MRKDIILCVRVNRYYYYYYYYYYGKSFRRVYEVYVLKRLK